MSTIDGSLIAAFFTGLAGLILAIGKVLMDLRQVHAAVNSNMEAAMGEIKALNERVAHLIAERTEKTHDQPPTDPRT